MYVTTLLRESAALCGSKLLSHAQSGGPHFQAWTTAHFSPHCGADERLVNGIIEAQSGIVRYRTTCICASNELYDVRRTDKLQANLECLAGNAPLDPNSEPVIRESILRFKLALLRFRSYWLQQTRLLS